MMESKIKPSVNIMELPVSTEEHTFGSWRVTSRRSHILQSKCSKGGQCEECGDRCLYCVYTQELALPHMPDMVFAKNSLTLKHKSTCGIEFNALDALKGVCSGKLNIKVACAEVWQEARQEAGHLEQVKPFDWTFTTDYKGTVFGNIEVQQTEQRIDINKLRQKEQILFYHDLTLFEDELHDNGTAVCSVKIRVMPSSFFILLRYFLRVDNVKVRVNDTRLYSELDTDYVLREFTSREADINDLKVPYSVLSEPNEVVQLLPLVKEEYEKLIISDPEVLEKK